MEKAKELISIFLFFGFCRTFEMITKTFFFPIAFKTADLHDNICTTLTNGNTVTFQS